jgi:CheY-like chemotaxis protein
MPGGLTGFDLIQAVKALDANTLCVVITGFGSMETAVRSVRYGAYDFIQKPFKLAEVEAVLDRALEHARVLSQLSEYQAELENRVLARVQDLHDFHEEVLVLNDLLVASQDFQSEGPLMEPFMAHLCVRFKPDECLAVLPTPFNGWRVAAVGAGGDAGTGPPAIALPPPSTLKEPMEGAWSGRCADGHLVPLQSGGLLHGAVYLGFQERSGFHPEDRIFVLWRRQLEAALHGLRRTRDLVGAERSRAGLGPGGSGAPGPVA